MIRLQPISHKDRDRVNHIAVLPEQEPFCGSIAHHFDDPRPNFDFHVVLRDDHPVGFFKIDRDYRAEYPFALPDELGLRGVMIDRREQGKGTGKAAMAELLPYLSQQYPQASSVALTVNEVNPLARAVYLAAGFIDTGEMFHGGRISAQHIMRLSLKG